MPRPRDSQHQKNGDMAPLPVIALHPKTLSVYKVLQQPYFNNPTYGRLALRAVH
jgi:hypothetical protein